MEYYKIYHTYNQLGIRENCKQIYNCFKLKQSYFGIISIHYFIHILNNSNHYMVSIYQVYYSHKTFKGMFVSMSHQMTKMFK